MLVLTEFIHYQSLVLIQLPKFQSTWTRWEQIQQIDSYENSSMHEKEMTLNYLLTLVYLKTLS